MAAFQINNREIKSFKLYKQTLDLRQFYNSQNQNGIFMMCDSLHPKERILLRNDLSKNNLKITILSKNTINFLFQNNFQIKNLLSGNVILIQSKNKESFKEDLFKFLVQQEKMSIRFFLSHNILYRKNKVFDLFASLQEDKNNASLIKKINFPIKKLFNNVIPFGIKTNYAKQIQA